MRKSWLPRVCLLDLVSVQMNDVGRISVWVTLSLSLFSRICRRPERDR